jgi:hypothetical protein
MMAGTRLSAHVRALRAIPLWFRENGPETKDFFVSGADEKTQPSRGPILIFSKSSLTASCSLWRSEKISFDGVFY